jgi:hypothetical protein
MIHYLPAQGYFNHGLVNYNPKFFWMLARSNGYKLVYQDMVLGSSRYELPQNIIDSIAEFCPDIGSRARDYGGGADCGILVVLQKQFDIPFVAPLDVPTGSTTNIRALKKRYWTMFEPDPFSRPDKPRDRWHKLLEFWQK